MTSPASVITPASPSRRRSGQLHTFYVALLQERTLLSQALMDELLDFNTVDVFSGYGLGLNEWRLPSGVAWGHAGGVLGFLSIGAYLPDDDIIIIILSASEDFSPAELALDIVTELLD